MIEQPGAIQILETYSWLQLLWFHCTNYQGLWWTRRSKSLEGRNWKEATLKILLVQRSKLLVGSLCNTTSILIRSRYRNTCWFLTDTSALPRQMHYCTSTCPRRLPIQCRLRKSWMEAWQTKVSHSTHYLSEGAFNASLQWLLAFAGSIMAVQMVSLGYIQHGFILSPS